jgi:ABC-type antimicrobial peptide transport system permease subunit
MHRGMGDITGVGSIIGGVLGLGSSYLTGQATVKAAQVNAAAALSAAKIAQKTAQTEEQQAAAMQQQQAAISAAQSIRDQEVAALFAIGAVAVGIAGLFLYSALKKKK